MPVWPTGRPAIWCSQGCRRAAYEERRAAARGASAVTIVDRTRIVEHALTDCVARVTDSPSACRRVLQTLTGLFEDVTVVDDPKWASTFRAAEKLFESIRETRPTRRWRRAPCIVIRLRLTRRIHTGVGTLR